MNGNQFDYNFLSLGDGAFTTVTAKPKSIGVNKVLTG